MRLPAAQLTAAIGAAMLIALPAAAAEPGGQAWPQFRGPDGQGVASWVQNPPLKWSETQNVIWRASVIGRGWSSPVASGDEIWVTTAVEQDGSAEFTKARLAEEKHAKSRQVAQSITLRAICFDATNGSKKHDVKLFEVASPDAIHLVNSYASPTPVLTGGKLYCHFGTFGAAAIDTTTGRVLWRTQTPLVHNVGPGSSPIVFKDLMILTCDGVDHQFISALNCKTGEEVWRTKRPQMRATDGDRRKAYATPLVITVAGKPQVVIPGAQWVVAYEPLTGKEIWRVDHGAGFSNVPRPVYGHGMVYICTGFPRPELWAIDPAGKGDVSRSHVKWKLKRQISEKPSPLIAGDEIYVLSDKGIVSCFDALTGEEHYVKRIGGNFAASPVAAAGNIYICNQEGETTVFAAGKKYGKSSRNLVEGSLMASPIFNGEHLILRTSTHLYCIGNRNK